MEQKTLFNFLHYYFFFVSFNPIELKSKIPLWTCYTDLEREYGSKRFERKDTSMTLSVKKA